jgi:hypothetical protein
MCSFGHETLPRLVFLFNKAEPGAMEPANSRPAFAAFRTAPRLLRNAMPVSLRTIAPAEADIRLDRWFHRHYPNLTQGALALPAGSIFPEEIQALNDARNKEKAQKLKQL